MAKFYVKLFSLNTHGGEIITRIYKCVYERERQIERERERERWGGGGTFVLILVYSLHSYMYTGFSVLNKNQR